jgi:hypothetical protein
MGTKATSLLAGLLLILPLAASADEPLATNPDYAHALPDLRTARWLLTQQPGNPAMASNEERAIQDIDVAIRTITMGVFNDHRDVSDHEQIVRLRDRVLERIDRAERSIGGALETG